MGGGRGRGRRRGETEGEKREKMVFLKTFFKTELFSKFVHWEQEREEILLSEGHPFTDELYSGTQGVYFGLLPISNV